MRSGSLSGFIFLWVCMIVLCSIAEERNVAYATIKGGATNLTSIQALFKLDLNWSSTTAWVAAIWNIVSLWFNGTLWQGQWKWVYYLLCVTMLVGFFETIVMAIISGISNFISGR